MTTCNQTPSFHQCCCNNAPFHENSIRQFGHFTQHTRTGGATDGIFLSAAGPRGSGLAAGLEAGGVSGERSTGSAARQGPGGPQHGRLDQSGPSLTRAQAASGNEEETTFGFQRRYKGRGSAPPQCARRSSIGIDARGGSAQGQGGRAEGASASSKELQGRPRREARAEEARSPPWEGGIEVLARWQAVGKARREAEYAESVQGRAARAAGCCKASQGRRERRRREKRGSAE